MLQELDGFVNDSWFVSPDRIVGHILLKSGQLAPSSNGLGHQVLILEIAGSNPAGVTNQQIQAK